jgi:hypothetical protein
VIHFSLAGRYIQNSTSRGLFPVFNLNLIGLPAVEASTTAAEMKSSEALKEELVVTVLLLKKFQSASGKNL